MMSHTFKVGDRVRIKTVEQMNRQYGSLEGDGVKFAFCRSMYPLCGATATISEIKPDGHYKLTYWEGVSSDTDLDWSYSSDMLEPVYSMRYATDHPAAFKHTIISNSFTTTTMTNLISKFKMLVKSEPAKTFIKTGITHEDGSLTSEGRELYMQWKFEQDAAEFAKQVATPLLQEQESSK